MANEAFSLKSASTVGRVTVGRVGNRYVWQGGQTENQGGQTKNFFRRFAPNFAHPGLKPCRRPWCRMAKIIKNRLIFQLFKKVKRKTNGWLYIERCYLQRRKTDDSETRLNTSMSESKKIRMLVLHGDQTILV